MNSLSAIKTKSKITKRALSIIKFLLNMCNLSTAWQWTPTHVIHLSYSVIKWKLFISLLQSLIKIEVFYVSVIHLFIAWAFGTSKLSYLPIIYLLNYHITNTLCTKVMFTTWHEEEFGSKLITCTDAAIVLLLVKLPSVSWLRKSRK